MMPDGEFFYSNAEQCNILLLCGSPQIKNQKGSRRFATVREPYVLAAGRFAAHHNYQPLCDCMDDRAYGHRDVLLLLLPPIAADAAAGCNYSALSQGR